MTYDPATDLRATTDAFWADLWRTHLTFAPVLAPTFGMGRVDGSIPLMVNEHCGDSAVFLVRMWNDEPVLMGSTRAWGAQMAHNLASAYRPEGL